MERESPYQTTYSALRRNLMTGSTSVSNQVSAQGPYVPVRTLLYGRGQTLGAHLRTFVGLHFRVVWEMVCGSQVPIPIPIPHTTYIFNLRLGHPLF